MKRRKPTNVRRLSNNEVALVAEMQQKIDFYERFLFEVSVMCATGKTLYILEDKYSSGDTGTIYKFVKKMITLEQTVNSTDPSSMMHKFMDDFPKKEVKESIAYRDGIIATLRLLGIDVTDNGKILKRL